MTKKSEIPTLFRCDNTHTPSTNTCIARKRQDFVRSSNPPLNSASWCGNVCPLPLDPSWGVYDAAGPWRTTARERGRPHKRYGSLPRDLTIYSGLQRQNAHGRTDSQAMVRSDTGSPLAPASRATLPGGREKGAGAGRPPEKRLRDWQRGGKCLVGQQSIATRPTHTWSSHHNTSFPWAPCSGSATDNAKK